MPVSQNVIYALTDFLRSGLHMPNGWSYIFNTWHDFAPPRDGARGKCPLCPLLSYATVLSIASELYSIEHQLVSVKETLENVKNEIFSLKLTDTDGISGWTETLKKKQPKTRKLVNHICNYVWHTLPQKCVHEYHRPIQEFRVHVLTTLFWTLSTFFVYNI